MKQSLAAEFKKKISGINKTVVLAIIFSIISAVSVIYLMNYVQLLLNEDARVNLTEIVTQNKDLIINNLNSEIENLELEAKQLSVHFESVNAKTGERMINAYLDFSKDERSSNVIFATASGVAYTADGQKTDVSGRAYFRLGLDGIPNISDRLISRLDGQDVFIMCVPVRHGDEVVGSILRLYTLQEMYTMCSASLFSKQGSTYIVNSQGYILVCPNESLYNRESDNYYRIIYFNDREAAGRLEADINNEKSGFMEAVVDGSKTFFAYTPVTQIHDWYLITSVATAAVLPNSNTIVKMFYVILMAVVVLFSITFLYYGRLKRSQQMHIEKLAFVDSVTGGDSYTKFTVDLSARLKAFPMEQCHVCCFDIDNFKFINRLYGFTTGDQILKEIYLLYKIKLLPGECIARVSGDRFALMLLNADTQRLNELFNFAPEINNIKIYISAGIYSVTDPLESVSLMVDKAEIAAKTSKGQHFKTLSFYTETIDQKMVRDEQLKRSVELALHNNEIIPFYQPKVNINSRELIGAEALARWHTAEGKFVSPAEFIPICEHTGLIALVDLTIFEQTLQFIKSNLDAGVKCVPISVNFSRMHLLNNSFLETIIKLLNKYGVPPALVELELTETAIFDNFTTISTFINDLHSHGLKISMDDFGSGYSSLHMLKDIDIDILKIDRGFLAGSLSDERQRIIFGSIVEMAHKLSIQTIVEGVETEENVALMNEFNCIYAQGYFYSKPVDTDAFDKIYKDGSL